MLYLHQILRFSRNFLVFLVLSGSTTLELTITATSAGFDMMILMFQTDLLFLLAELAFENKYQ